MECDWSRKQPGARSEYWLPAERIGLKTGLFRGE
jgi:hypothetical protein